MHHEHVALPIAGDWLLLFGASLLASAHCVGMCGPYVAVCTAQFVPRGATPAHRFYLRVLFNVGRIATYGLLGLIIGAFGEVAQALAWRAGLAGLVALVAGVFATACGLALLGWIRDPARALGGVWLQRSLMAWRVRLQSTPAAVSPLLLGVVQGWLPCALVYAAASRAGASGNALMGALTMVVFGLGTVPAIFALTIVPQAVLQRIKAQRLAGVLLSALGMLLILRGLTGLGWLPSAGWW